MGMRIPLRDGLAGLDVGAVLDVDDRTVGHLVALALTTMGIHDRQFAGTRNRDQVAIAVLHGLEVVELDRTGGLHVHVVDGSCTRGGTADMERTHGQLGTGLTNRLGGDDADRLADVDDVAAGQIASVAESANAERSRAGDRRTHEYRLHAIGFQLLDDLLVEQGAAGDDRIFLVARRVHVLGNHATEHAIAQRLDHIAAFDDGGHGQAVLRAAIDRSDHHVLGHVDQATGQVTRVGRLQRGIGQTLSSTVGRVEVLQHIKAFAEVRLDRRLDDRAVRSRHQSAHAGQLANLRRRTTRAGVGHDVQRVHRLLEDFLTLGRLDLVVADDVHHGLGDQFVGARPDIDNLVVALAGGDQTRLELLLDLDHFLFGNF